MRTTTMRRAFAAALALSLLAGSFHSMPAKADTVDAVMTVYKTPWCGCCGAWVDHIRGAGFTVEVEDLEDLSPVKRMAGVPDGLGSCHTAVIDGYVVEGHVPADILARFLEESPDARGLAVPGMPVGSPGMEGPNPEVYDVLVFDRDGGSETYQTIRP